MDRKQAVYHRILEYIIHFRQEYGYSPVFREIAQGIGYGSTSTVFDYLRDMKSLGMIDYRDESPRTITIPGYSYVKTA